MESTIVALGLIGITVVSYAVLRSRRQQAEDDVSAMARSIATFRPQLETHIREWWGDRCPEYDPRCCICQQWTAFDRLAEHPAFSMQGPEPRRPDDIATVPRRCDPPKAPGCRLSYDVPVLPVALQDVELSPANVAALEEPFPHPNAATPFFTF